ncbi:Bug family tripartite tricarboxylate transporter substrate binding protein [Hydrogenophaga sp.]|uniref:Bug family tripartite tricarboxylate transporter substrate binding protein n=1 Tax=Hydrogenophaga sp. TaxID=1904254 RepID=UPI003F701C80
MLNRTRVLLGLFLALLVPAVFADAYPSKAITVIVPYGPGGGTDLFARLYATELATRLKRPVVVENLAGAGGTVAVQKVMNGIADGYTLVISNGMEFEMLQMADPENAKGRTTNLTPISLFGTQPMVLVARPALGIKTADELVAMARSKPGALSLASSGPGTSLYLAGEMIKKAAQVEMLNVPYKAGPQIVTDLLGGNVDVAVLAVPTALGQIQTGKLTALGVTDATRSPALPDVPSLNDSKSIKDVEAKVWYAVYGPPKLPADVVQTLQQASREMMADAGIREKLVAMAITPAKDGGAEELHALRNGQLSKFLSIFREKAGK